MDAVISLDALCGALARLAPLSLAESWDNVGLLVGDRRATIDRVMTCLTITPNVVEEAVEERADLIITHHPLPFHPLTKITSDTITGSMLLRLMAKGVSVYSAHTAFDSASEGINQSWGGLLGLVDLRPLVESEDAQLAETVAKGDPEPTPAVVGSGRYGQLDTPKPLGELVRQAAAAVDASCPRLVGDPARQVVKVALACGSGGSFLAAAARHGCDAMITGEATFHTCLEAESRGIGLGLLGHYFSERFAMERLAETIGQEFADITIWASRSERDPLTPL